jgi:hypothetical protein
MSVLKVPALTGIVLLAFVFPLHASLRSFSEVFPNIDPSERAKVFSNSGLRHSFKKNETQSLFLGSDSGVDLMKIALQKNPAHFIETAWLVPYSGKLNSVLDVYNALSRISDIKNHSYYNYTRKAAVYAFEESVRLESAEKNNPIPDPPPASVLPDSESIYMRIKDRSFGTVYVRGDVSPSRYGLICQLTNFKAIRFLLFPVLKAEKFTSVVYFEPIVEGVLVHTLSAVDIPDFFLSRGNIIRDIDRRFAILSSWLSGGLRKDAGI